MKQLVNLSFLCLMLISFSSCCDCYKKQAPPPFKKGEVQPLPGYYENANDAKDAIPLQRN
jgi:hypothetical protein